VEGEKSRSPTETYNKKKLSDIRIGTGAKHPKRLRPAALLEKGTFFKKDEDKDLPGKEEGGKKAQSSRGGKRPSTKKKKDHDSPTRKALWVPARWRTRLVKNKERRGNQKADPVPAPENDRCILEGPRRRRAHLRTKGRREE